MKANQMLFQFSILCLTFALSACSLQDDMYVYSGTLEADELPIIAEVGGKVESISVDEGTKLSTNQELIQLDSRSYELSVMEAEAALVQATAKLEEAQAGNRSQLVQKGVAGTASAEAGVKMAETRGKQAETSLERANKQVAQGEQLLAGAKKTLQYEQKRLQDAEKLFQSGAMTKREVDVQAELVNKAETQVAQLTTQLEMTKTQLIVATQDVEAANVQVATTKAQRDVAYADLDLLQEGSTDYQLKSLLAAQKQASVKLDNAKLQLEKTKLVAPENTIVLRKNVTAGEVVKPGATVFTLMKQDKLEVKVYVPEAELGKVKVGQKTSIKVDAYPDEVFSGTIQHVSDKAEFTPKNVQTKDERTKMVFAVTIQVEEGLDRLKPGMPADILLEDGVQTP
ncbi:HlyD family secretion protein [Brevibacillus daliensis]|uniref:HlyD family secretion protein n=1 Tax=Brevibacillus daliensis TaxID=2892995 RepID=UPI001E316BB2|nr:HlyD family efflux transporter periplasmic adaptor subunit [Brevibacillus daliensis]